MARQNGIVLIGSTLVDELIPVLGPGELTYVDANRFVPDSELKGEKISFSVGGMALNVAVNLAKIGGRYPVAVCGRVGRDHRARLIRSILRQHDIDDTMLVEDSEFESSWTEVLNLRLAGGELERVFRHTLGAMGRFNGADIPFDRLSAFRIALCGYGLLLPSLDLEDAEFGTALGRVLAEIKQRGVRTAIDFVSPGPENLFKFRRYRRALSWVDICCINDDQARALTDEPSAEKACRILVAEMDVGLAVIHCGAEGPNYGYDAESGLCVQPNYRVEPEHYKGNAGAGDAFSAGLLHGLHQAWSLGESMRFAAAAAAVSLGDVSCTGAMRNQREIQRFMERTPYRS